MNRTVVIVFFLAFIFTKAQTGIGTTSPDASAKLDVYSTNKGLLPPRLTLNGNSDNTTIPNPATGLLVYNTGNNVNLAAGYYYWNGSAWVVISTAVGNMPISFGDIKTGIQTTDHNGWIKLDGRLKSSLTSTQQTRATNLGIGTNLPNATNSVLMQNGNTLGAVSGSNSKTISQANLPNINFPTATTTYNGDHSHTFTRPIGDQNFSNGSGNTWWGFSSGATIWTSTAGAHTHNVTVSSGGSGTALDVTPQSLSINMFIYLGI